MRKKPFFPKLVTELVLWVYNYKSKIETFATTLGMTPEEVAAEIEYCDNIIDSINAVVILKNDLKGIIDTRNNVILIDGAKLRKDIKRHKTAVGYTDSIGAQLGIVGSDTDFDPNTYKPEINIEPFGSIIHISFIKKGVDGVNIYKRKKAEETFKLVTRATKSPYKYQPVLEETAKPEHWEFRAFGVINDTELGVPSNIVDFVYSTK